MLGATDTTRGPDVAPAGMVIRIDVPLHELIVTGASFNSTMLFPCDDPKPLPDTDTWLPAGPVVAESPVIIGEGFVGVLTDT